MRYCNVLMSGYAKLFSRILDSTIWREDDTTRILWIAMLALADRDGVVQCTIPGLADRARITLEQCEHALERFQLPDKYSWSKEEEGRRIKTVEGGWFLINHAKYRALMSKDEQREKTRIRVAGWRKSNGKQNSLHSVTGVTSNESNDIASASTEASSTKTKTLSPSAPKKVKDADFRFKPFVEVISRAHKYYVKDQEGNSVEPEFNAIAGKNLNRLLKSRPNLDEKKFRVLLKNYHESADHAPAEQPAFYIPRLTRYETGTLNAFGRENVG